MFPYLKNVFQPWIVGRYYSENLANGFGNSAYTRPSCAVGLMILTGPFSFDQVGIYVSTGAGTSSLPVRLGIYQMNPKTWLPDSLIEEFGTVNGQTLGAKTINLAPAKTYNKLLGLAVQVETGGGLNPIIARATSPLYRTVLGYSTAELSGSNAVCGYLLTGGDVTVGSLPTVDKFAYSKLQQWGSGLFLRRA